MLKLATGVVLATGGGACYTSSTTRTEAPAAVYGQTGTVERVQQVVRRVRGDPAAGALAGALIGGILFGGHGPRTLFGAAAGAATGAALSSGSYETRAYEVLVRFDDGSRGSFTYRDYAPFRPGDRVQLTPDGPVRIAYDRGVY